MFENYEIIRVNDHYEVYIDGNFYCSTDSVIEAENEIYNTERK